MRKGSFGIKPVLSLFYSAFRLDFGVEVCAIPLAPLSEGWTFLCPAEMCSVTTCSLLPRRMLCIMEMRSQQEDGRSIPRLMGATRCLQLPTPEKKQVLQIFCNYFAKNLELVAFFQVGWRCNFPKSSSALSSPGYVGCLQTSLLPSLPFPSGKLLFPPRKFEFQ